MTTCMEHPQILEANAYIRTFSGGQFNFIGEYWESGDIHITDIAVALSRVPRFAGHTKWPYFVGQHSVHVSEVIENWGGSVQQQMLGLLHDAAEFALVDIPSPAKKLLPQYRELEGALWDRISHRFFGEVIKLPPIVKNADRSLLQAEMRDLFVPSSGQHLEEGILDAMIKIHPWYGDYAAHRFLERFKELKAILDAERIPKMSEVR